MTQFINASNKGKKDTHGKSVVAGCKTLKDEHKSLLADGKRLSAEQRKREKQQTPVVIKTSNGTLYVDPNKYLKNKEHYDSLSVGKTAPHVIF